MPSRPLGVDTSPSPPPRSGADGDNLPALRTTFLGRENERAAVSALLDTERLITLTGAGGCGKTRLALQVAVDVRDRYSDGIRWVDLARVSDGALVPTSVAAAIRAKEVPGKPLIETVNDVLRDRSVLVLLDNCEHLVDACAALADEVLSGCLGVAILATSRELLGVEGEIAWRVPSLELPPIDATMEDTVRCGSVRLFVERASRVKPDFRVTHENETAVAEICRRLDGIPLAIELAAARVRMMTPEQIAHGLEDRFRLLTSSNRRVPPRHRTLRASVDWSHDHLSEDERAVFRRLSVFAGGFTLEAAETLCSGGGVEREAVLDIVSRLVDRSLVQVEHGGKLARYRLLETIRRYALDRLLWAGESNDVHDRHLRYFVALAERAEPEMEGAGLLEWLGILDAEHDDLRSASDRSVQVDAAEDGLRLVGSLWQFWQLRGHFTEGRRRAELALRADDVDPRVRAKALVGLAQLEIYHGDLAATARFAEEALRISRELDDERGEGRALDALAWATGFLDPPAAPAMFERSAELLERSGDGAFLADALNGLGIARFLGGDLLGARGAFERSVATARGIGNLNTLTIGVGVLGYVAALQGRLDEASGHFDESLALARRLRDDVFTAQGLFGTGLVAALRGRHEEAEALLAESVVLVREASPLMLTFAFVTRAIARWIRSDVEGSAADAAHALELSRALGLPWPAAWSLAILANAAGRNGDLDTARARLAEALDVEGSVGMRTGALLDARARLARDEGDVLLAESLHHQAIEAAKAIDSVLLVPAQLEAIAGLASLGESHAEAARLFGAAGSARAAHGIVRAAVDEEAYRADVARSRDASPEDFVSAWDEGAGMSLDEVLAYVSRGRGARKRPATGWDSLTPTELEVVRRVAEGLTNPQIAERLFVSRSTVKVHLAHIFAKLGVSTRAELAVLATKREL